MVLAGDGTELGGVNVEVEVVVVDELGEVVVEDEEDEDEEEDEVLGEPVTVARRDLSSLFSFLVSVRFFSRVSMCDLNSVFKDESLAIF